MQFLAMTSVKFVLIHLKHILTGMCIETTCNRAHVMRTVIIYAGLVGKGKALNKTYLHAL